MRKKFGYFILFFVIFTGMKLSVSFLIDHLFIQKSYITNSSSSENSSDTIPLDDIEENADQDIDIDFIDIPCSMPVLRKIVMKAFSPYLFNIYEIHLGLTSPPPKH